MATVTFLNNPVHTAGELPQRGTTAPKFELVKGDLSTLTDEELRGKRVLLNIFPSLDTNVCATSVRKFNQKAAQMKNTLVLAISKDLPFAQSRFCATEGIDNVVAVSAFRSTKFGKEYGVELIDGPLAGLLCRAVIIIDELAEEYEGRVNIGKVDVDGDGNEEVVGMFGIRNIPTVLFFKDGKLVDKVVGATTKENFRKKIDALL